MPQPTCSVAGCERASITRGLCESHYRAVLHARKKCSVEGCERGAATRGLCATHYGHLRATETCCSIEGCERHVAARGWCAMHYHRWQRNGSPFAVKLIVGDDRARLLSHIDCREPDECWPWTGSIDPRGYGRAGGGERGSRLAHRAVYDAFVGPIAEGLTIDHACHVASECAGGPTCPHRRCVNPAHLTLVEAVPNMMRGNAPAAINARKTHCNQGHPFDEENTGHTTDGRRYCRTCRLAWKARARARAKAAA